MKVTLEDASNKNETLVIRPAKVVLQGSVITDGHKNVIVKMDKGFWKRNDAVYTTVTVEP